MPRAHPAYANFSDMPEALQNFVFSDAFTDTDATLQKQYGLSDAQKTVVSDKVMDAIFGSITLSQAIADARAAVVPSPVREEQWNAFLVDLLKLELWPLRELFGEELTQLLNEQKVNTAGWPPFRVLLKPLTYSGAASEIAATAGFSIAGPLRERLRDLVMSRSKGVRIDLQVKETLMRQSDFGGLGLDESMADKTIAAMNTLIGSVKLLAEDEYANWLADEARKKATEQVSPPQLLEEEAEIAAIRAKTGTVPTVPPSVLDQAIESIYSGIANRPADTYLANRLRHVISSRLRDVRSEHELRMLLQRDPKVGGLGMTHDAAERMGSDIEAGYRAFHDRILEEEKHRLDQQMEEQKQKIADRRAREVEEHAKWYREKVLAQKQEETKQGAFTEQLKRAMAVAPEQPLATSSSPIDHKEKHMETARFGELVSVPTTTSVAAQSTSPIGVAAVQPIPASRPEVKVSKATAELSATIIQQKPRLDDVKMTGPRLTGPIQELKTLSISEFRRLAKSPESAAQKILQKFDVLGQESMERKLEGVKAFQQSELQRVYMALVAEAFRAGKPVLQLAEAKRAAGQDVPSADELSAIISLNSALHF